MPEPEDTTECPLGGVCAREQEWGHPCDRDQHGSRIEACDKNAARGEDRYVQLGDVLRSLKKEFM